MWRAAGMKKNSSSKLGGRTNGTICLLVHFLLLIGSEASSFSNDVAVSKPVISYMPSIQANAEGIYSEKLAKLAGRPCGLPCQRPDDKAFID